MNKKRFLPLLAATALLLASAQAGFAGTDHVQPRLSQEEIQDPNGNLTTLTLADLGYDGAVELRGPFQSATVQFTLPYAWELTGDVILDLRLNSAFQSLMEAFTTEDLSEELAEHYGVFTIEVNGQTASQTRVSQEGSATLQIAIPANLFLLNGQRNSLTLSWDASVACQLSITTAVVVDGTSILSFPAQDSAVAPNLDIFPAPFHDPYAVRAEAIAALLPASPDAGTLSALAAVAAGLGRHSDGDLDLPVYTADDLPDAVLKNHHLVLVGTHDEIADIFKKKQAPLAIEGSSEGGAGEIAMLPSAWNPERALLVITGQDTESLQKAAGAIASDIFLTDSDGNRVSVTEVTDPLAETQWQIDQSFADLFNTEEISITRLGAEQIAFSFFVPPDITLSPEAYLELYFRHSQLINYLQSSISVDLNGRTIGTIRFGDVTATNGLARIILPPNSIRPLRNDLTLNFSIVSQDLCADDRSGNYWVTVFGDSYLHLPPALETAPLAKNLFLDNLRNVFFSNGSFSDLTLIIPQNDHDAVQTMVDLAMQFGAASISNLMMPDVKFIGESGIWDTGEEKVVIATGAVLAENKTFNTILPLPFQADGRLKQINLNGVSFAVDERQDYGLLEVLRTGERRTPVLLVSGNTQMGISLAVNALSERMAAPGSGKTNVQLIDSSGSERGLLVPVEAVEPIGDAPEAPMKWTDFLLDSQSNRLALYLFIVFAFATAFYGLWMYYRSRK